jgi:hypothetical protein
MKTREWRHWDITGIHLINIILALHLKCRHYCICQQDFAENPDIAVSCEAMPVLGKQKWMLTVSYWMEHRAPNGGARESTQGAKGVGNPIVGTTIWTNQYPLELVSLAAYVSEVGLVGHHWEEKPLGLANFIICLSTGECQGQEVGVGG